MFKSLRSKLLGFVTGLAVVAGMAVAANTFYAGYRIETNQNGIPGLITAGGPVPTVTGTCGTIPAAVGGTSTGQVTTAAVTSCQLTFTLAAVAGIGVLGGLPGVAAPTGIWCTVFDLTHPAVEAIASTSTTTCVTGTMTITAGDVIQYHIEAY